MADDASFPKTTTVSRRGHPSARPAETRKPALSCIKSATTESCVEPAIRATVNTIMIMAGSASDANSISRLEPMPPKLVPMSMPASAGKKRAEPMSAMMTMRSPTQPKVSPVAKVGTRAAATQVAAKIM